MRLAELAALQHVNWKPEKSDRQRSALAMMVGFGVMGGFSTLRAGAMGKLPVALWVTGLALAVSLLIPVVGPRIHVGISVASGLMGALVSRVILGLMFALVFVPLGLFLRLSGKDLLDRKPGASMWREREQREAESYYKQF
jgi:hypothetical protein